ncbi:CGGC domain-containing protein [Dehalobacterium formicoaceticum]|uniref:CGGC domain-containing protein n=1 Tax=Dehalobacterium formicoaceticum TaxID=51515 RepID=A0ABT1Y1F6_9FIRM|nr:CGGC domain-containing protein [Dehalobacterium formicoaceticum]MCR6544403.1 CGGC domain-containing protein [Dehalobacterium formicoaceticum]
MKIGILVREETMQKCTGKGCLSAFQKRKDSFARYDEPLELLAFTHVGGELEHKITRMINNEISVVHLSSCLRTKSPDYEALAERLAEHFDVVGYTHGSAEGKKRETIMRTKKPKVQTSEG